MDTPKKKGCFNCKEYTHIPYKGMGECSQQTGYSSPYYWCHLWEEKDNKEVRNVSNKSQ